MGNQNAINYASFIEGTEQPGHTKELVQVIFIYTINCRSDYITNMSEAEKKRMLGSEGLVERPDEGIDTLLKAFKRSVERYPNEPYLGTRDNNQEGRPYVWKTWK